MNSLDSISTPKIVLDMDIAERNISRYCALASKYGKQLWPMVKTHKSSELMLLQKEYGCTGVLCGTLDEAEAALKCGFENIMYAYPVASEQSIRRVLKLASECAGFVIRLDDSDGAAGINALAEEEGVCVNYTVIIDSGLHRFGVKPEDASLFADKLKPMKQLVFRGISTHPGHVYGAASAAEVGQCVQDEKNAVRTAVEALRAAGYVPEIVSSGSTPTFEGAVDDEFINVLHPGNYIFNDCIQISNGTAVEDDCSLYIAATVISHPREGLWIIDAGAKCLGLDQGAHGNGSIKGFGQVKGHPELTVFSLSEEVGKLHAEGNTDIKTGDRLYIIPNHSCSAANLTSAYTCVRGVSLCGTINVDIRGNSRI